jgi:hypothetical protein
MCCRLSLYRSSTQGPSRLQTRVDCVLTDSVTIGFVLQSFRFALPFRLSVKFAIHGLFNNAVSSSDYTASDDSMMNNELERIWKEAVVA